MLLVFVILLAGRALAVAGLVVRHVDALGVLVVTVLLLFLARHTGSASAAYKQQKGANSESRTFGTIQIRKQRKAGRRREANKIANGAPHTHEYMITTAQENTTSQNTQNKSGACRENY